MIVERAALAPKSEHTSLSLEPAAIALIPASRGGPNSLIFAANLPSKYLILSTFLLAAEG